MIWCIFKEKSQRNFEFCWFLIVLKNGAVSFLNLFTNCSMETKDYPPPLNYGDIRFDTGKLKKVKEFSSRWFISTHMIIFSFFAKLSPSSKFGSVGAEFSINFSFHTHPTTRPPNHQLLSVFDLIKWFWSTGPYNNVCFLAFLLPSSAKPKPQLCWALALLSAFLSHQATRQSALAQ